MTWIIDHLDEVVQFATLFSILGAGALLKKIASRLGKITALPETVDRLSSSVSILSDKLQQMDVDVKEAIGVKRHITEILTRLSNLESLTVKQ